MKTNFYLDNKPINPPANFKELAIEVNFDKDVIQSQISTNKWIFVRDNAEYINDFISKGVVGGVGVLEGIPFRIEIEKGGAKYTVFDGHLDLTDGVEISCDEVRATSKLTRGIDWLNENADGFTFDYIDSKGGSLRNKQLSIPYCINKQSSGVEIATMTLTILVLSQEVLREVDYYTGMSPNLANPFTATFAITIAVHALYTIALIITIVKTIQELIRLLIQPVKYHSGMYVKDLMEAGAKEMGYTFSSTIFNTEPFNKLVIIPEKYNVINAGGGLLGFLEPNRAEQNGYYRGTFGDFLRTFKTIFNAKIVIEGSVMHFERKDANISANLYQLPELRNDFYTLNTEDFKANTLIQFRTDINDKNTIRDYTGNSFQAITQPITKINSNMVLMKGLDTIQIPFALARAKEELNYIEEIVKVFADGISIVINALIKVFNAIIKAVNAVIAFFNKVVNAIKLLIKIPKASAPQIPSIKPVDFGALLDDRIGMLVLENDFIDVPKLLVVEESNVTRRTKPHRFNNNIVSAKYLYENFHYIDSFVEQKGQHGQYFIYNLPKVPFCFSDYEKIRTNNIIKEKSSNFALLDSCKWNVYGEYAEIKYRVNKKFTTNVKLTSIEPNGK